MSFPISEVYFLEKTARPWEWYAPHTGIRDTMQFPEIWKEMMVELDELVAIGEDRREVMAWMQEQYDTLCCECNGEIYGPGEPVFDVQGRL